MEKNEAIRHHYIPQFILRNFCFNASGDINYYDVASGEISIQRVSEIFMQRNLYRDEINHLDVPTQIEKDLAKYEGESAKTIKKFCPAMRLQSRIERTRACCYSSRLWDSVHIGHLRRS